MTNKARKYRIFALKSIPIFIYLIKFISTLNCLKFLLAALLLFPLGSRAQTSQKLSGTIIGTSMFVDYATGNMSTTVNTRENAFDGNLDTYLATYGRSGTWVGLNADDLCDWVDETAAYLDASQRLNFTRWPIMTQYVHMNPRVHGSYAAEVDNVKSFLRKRVAWMDQKLHFDATGITAPIYNTRTHEDDDTIYDLSGRVVNKPVAGQLYIQSGKKIIK